MKKALLIIATIFTVTWVYADQVNVTSYYPIPYGRYDHMRLVPRADLSEPCSIGLLYSNSSGVLQYCRDNGSGVGTWGAFSGPWTMTHSLLFPTDTDSNPDLMIGIGTTTPTETLHIAGTGELLLEDTSVSIELIDTVEHDFRLFGGNDDKFRIQSNVESQVTEWLSKVTFTSAGDIGIGTDDPQARLHISEGIIFAEGSRTVDDTISIAGAGTRLLWYPRKAALRAGRTYDTRWDDANIGFDSIAMGDGPMASGANSTAFGFYTTASGDSSTALGKATVASGSYSTAMGFESDAIGDKSIAMGYNTSANGEFGITMGYESSAEYGAIAMGYQTNASGNHSIAGGRETTASGNYSTAIGYKTTASADKATAIGNQTSATNNYSTAFGSGTTASGYCSIAMGQGITVSGSYSAGIALSDQTGTVAAQDNTLAIMGGFVGIGLINPTEELHVVGNIKATGTITQGSSRKLKNHIQALSTTEALSAINSLEPVIFQYKKEKSNDLHLGFIAEDIPNLLATPHRKGISSMDVISTMTKVVQYQQKRIIQHKNIIQEQEHQIHELEKMLQTFENKKGK